MPDRPCWRHLGSLVITAVGAALIAVVSPLPVSAHTSGFGDVPADAFYATPVADLAAASVFDGTECPAGFCPDEPIDRKTMAVWTVRVLDGSDPPAVSQARFNDVDADSFYAPFIERMAELEVTQGCGDGSGFCPDDTVTRSEMAAFISRSYDLPDGPDPGFSDVPADAWYAADVARLAASKITAGCGDGTRFCPGRATTRGQMATFLWRAENPDWRVDFEPAVAAVAAVTNPKFASVSVGKSHTCGIRVNQRLACWGAVEFGRLEYPTGRFTAVSAGFAHSCAIRVDQMIVCWGENRAGQIDAPDGRFTAVSAGGAHSCAIRVDQMIVCWGDDRFGQIDAPDGRFTTMSTGPFHSCAIRADQAIVCWGKDFYWSTTGLIDAPEGRFVAVSVGLAHSCAVRTDGTLTCWGDAGRDYEWRGQTGILLRTSPPSGTFLDVSAGYDYSCALRTDRSVICWSAYGFRDFVGGDNWHRCLAPNDAAACWSQYIDKDSMEGQFLSVFVGSAARSGDFSQHPCGVRLDKTVQCSDSYSTPGSVEGWKGREPEPIRAGCEDQSAEGKPGQPYDIVVFVGAIDQNGQPARQVSVNWASSCSGGEVDQYLVQWRRGNEDFGSDRQRSVEASHDVERYSLDLPDLEAYAVRVVARNDDGSAHSEESLVASPSNVLRSNIEGFIRTLSGQIPWLSDIWSYMSRPHSSFDFIPATHPCRRGIACAGPNLIALRYSSVFRLYNWSSTVVHELSHIYTLWDTLNSNQAAIGAGHLHLARAIEPVPERTILCEPEELYAELAEAIVAAELRNAGVSVEGPLRDHSGFGAVLDTCLSGIPDHEERRSFKRAFTDDAVKVGRSVFIEEMIPQWFFDTYRQSDGNWNIETLRADIDGLTVGSRPYEFRSLIYRQLRHLIPDL